MGASSRRKGAQGEREAADALYQLTGMAWRRTAPLQTHRGGSDCPDIDCDDVPKPGSHCEVKRGKRVNVRAALRQAEGDCGARVPWVLWRDDRDEWTVTVRLRHLRQLSRLLWPHDWRTR